MLKFRHIASVLLLAAVTACAGGGRGGDVSVPVHLSFPNPPAMMEQGQKMQYIAAHFWDSLVDTSRHYPCDSTFISGVDAAEVEQAMANYIMLSSSLPLDQARANIRRFASALMLCRAADSTSNVFARMTEMTERYMYDPNSPMRDEDLYMPFADEMSRCPFVPEARRAAYASDAALSSLNCRGTKAADFTFSDRRGRVYSLYGIKADLTILFFSNPGCTACKEIIEALQSDKGINDGIASGRVAVLNIYIDEDLGAWYDYMPIYPESWYNGYDHNHIIRGEEIYNVRAIPSLYLLDKDKKVILKDATTEKLINNLPWQQ